MSGKSKIALIVVLALAATLAEAKKEDSGKKHGRKTRTETVEKKTKRSESDDKKTKAESAEEAAGSDTAESGVTEGSGISAAAANRAVGAGLFSDRQTLWETPVAEVVKRMKLALPKGSEKTPTVSVFTKRKSSFFGCGVEEFRFFCREGKITRIDVMLLNKGDSVKGKVPSSRRFEFSKRLQREERVLSRNLDTAFGSANSIVFGIGSQSRRMPHWFCREAAIAVEMVDREYLMLHVFPREQAGRPNFRKDTLRVDRAKLDLTKNIRREKNGDVFISGVPMVDQGSKGYCVPATLERCFRYYGITEFDMHRIADAGKTAAGGGTALSNALAGLAPMLHDCRMRRVSLGRLRLRGVAGAIDAGTPIIWALYSSPEYLQRLQEHNAARAKIESPAAWKADLKKMRRLPSSKKGAHVCLIIGYNLTTGEIAVSNSWGAAPGADIAWVRFADAAAADADEDLYVLQPR